MEPMEGGILCWVCWEGVELGLAGELLVPRGSVGLREELS